MSLDLSYEKLDTLINEISLGGKVVPIKKTSGEEVCIFVSHCVGVDKLYADLEYSKAYERAISDGFLTVEETTKLLRSRGVLPPDDDVKIKALESKIEGQEFLLEKTTKIPANRDRIKGNIESLKNELLQILNKKEEHLEFCAEKKAKESQYLYLTWRASKDPYTMELFWPSREDFNRETDLTFRRNLFIAYVRASSGIDVSTIRYIARSNLWRIRYITSTKVGDSLFGRNIPEYTVDQLALSWWSHYYQSIYDMPSSDSPSDSIIEDDVSLDAFMKTYMSDRSRDNTQAREKKNQGGSKSAWDHGETIVMRSNPIYKDVEYSPTNESARNKEKPDLKIKK
jgi:hypothetical protein